MAAKIKPTPTPTRTRDIYSWVLRHVSKDEYVCNVENGVPNPYGPLGLHGDILVRDTRFALRETNQKAAHKRLDRLAPKERKNWRVVRVPNPSTCKPLPLTAEEKAQKKAMLARTEPCRYCGKKVGLMTLGIFVGACAKPACVNKARREFV